MDTQSSPIIPEDNSNVHGSAFSLKMFEIIVLAIVIAGGVWWYVSYQKNTGTLRGSYSSNQVVFDKAVSARDTKECDNIQNEQALFNSCKQQVREYLMSDAAIQKQDASQCGNIADQDLKNYCLNVTGALSSGGQRVLGTVPDTK